MADPAPPHRRAHGGKGAGMLAVVKPLPPKAVAGRPGSQGPSVRSYEKTDARSIARRVIEHPRVGRVAAWNDVLQHPASGIVTYRTYYQIIAAGPAHCSQSQIAFHRARRAFLTHRILKVERWMGDWSGAPWRPRAAEMIPLGRLR